MSLPINIRNKLALRSVNRICAQTSFSTITAKFWNVFSPNVELDNFVETQEVITTTAFGSRINILQIIDEIHRKDTGTIFYDNTPTQAFINRCKELINV
jgi:hypothetical protein